MTTIHDPLDLPRPRTDNRHLRGVVRCHSCSWYIGRRMLRSADGVCPICDATVEDDR